MPFQNTVDLDPGAGTATLGTPPGIDCAIVKYAANGSVVWARSISGPTTDATSVVNLHGQTQQDFIPTDLFGGIERER